MKNNRLESSIQSSIMKALRKQGGLWLKTRESLAGVSGISDIIGCYRGRFIAIEIKRPGEKPRADQQAYLEIVKRCGGISGSAQSVEEALNIIKGA